MIWEYVYNTEFVAFKDCYLTCNGYCCTMNNGFSILSSITLPLLEDEFIYYKQKGGIRNINDVKKEEFILPNDKRFIIYYLMCNCKGLCKPHYMRPLICRIYPFIPKVSFDGECDGFLYASLFDVIYNDTNHPCTLTRENKEEIFEVLREKLKPLLTEPKLVFAFKVLEILYFNLLEKLDLTKDINTLNKKLEFLLLSRKAWRSKEFKQDITQAYEEITKKIWRIFMKTYAIEEFEVFLKTQTKKAKNILIHSSIANLGIPTKNGRKIQPQNIMDYYLEILFKCESEVLMPSFNYSFTKKRFCRFKDIAK